nr:hypothetical protein [Mycoplasmopsis bovis]
MTYNGINPNSIFLTIIGLADDTSDRLKGVAGIWPKISCEFT